MNVSISRHPADEPAVANLTKILRFWGYRSRVSSFRTKPVNQQRLDRDLVADEAILRLCSLKMTWAGTLFVLISKQSREYPWLKWEVKMTEYWPIQIIGAFVHGGTEADLPPFLEKYEPSFITNLEDADMEAAESVKRQIDPLRNRKIVVINPQKPRQSE